MRHRPLQNCRSGIRAVTLTELLVALVIMVTLAALLFPIAGQLRERSQGVRCLNNLRNIGGILVTAISEKGGRFNAWYSGTTGGDFWNTMLVRDHYVTLETLQALSCPGIPYLNASGSYSGRHYGIYMPDPANHMIDHRSDSGALLGRAYAINVRTMPSPASSILLADSVTAAGDPTIRIFKTDSASFSTGGFHARHQGRANLFFYDGHVETPGPERLSALGVRKIYDGQLQPVVIPKL